MDKSREIRLLTELLDETPYLKQSNHDNNKYQLWRDRVLVTLAELYSENSREYHRFAPRFTSGTQYDTEDEKL